MCAFGIWIEILTLGNFYGGLYSHEITCFHGGVLSRNTIFSVCLWYSHEIYFMTVTHEISNSQEIHFMAVTLTKYQTLTKSVHEDDLSRNTTKGRHENTDANLVAMLFS